MSAHLFYIDTPKKYTTGDPSDRSLDAHIEWLNSSDRLVYQPESDEYYSNTMDALGAARTSERGVAIIRWGEAEGWHKLGVWNRNGGRISAEPMEGEDIDAAIDAAKDAYLHHVMVDVGNGSFMCFPVERETMIRKLEWERLRKPYVKYELSDNGLFTLGTP